MKYTAEEQYGYIVADTPEKVEALGAQQNCDEVHCLGVWWNWGIAGRPLEPLQTYRRPIPIEQGFELVGLDEVIKRGDQFTQDGNRWVEIHPDCTYFERPSKILFTSCLGEDSQFLAIRRRKASKEVTPSIPWTPFSDKMPTEGDLPILVCSVGRNETRLFDNIASAFSTPDHGGWHDWYSVKSIIPTDLPEAVDESERAFEEFVNKYKGVEPLSEGSKSLMQEAWLACAEYTKGVKK